MLVMHLNEVSSTLTWGSDVLSAASAETAMSRNVSAHSTIEVDTTGRKSSSRESKARRFLSPQVPAADRLPGLNGMLSRMVSMLSIIIAEAPGREGRRTALQSVQVLQPLFVPSEPASDPVRRDRQPALDLHGLFHEGIRPVDIFEPVGTGGSAQQ